MRRLRLLQPDEAERLGLFLDQAVEFLVSEVRVVVRLYRLFAVDEHAERAADQLERLATRLKNKDAAELFRDAQNLARRQPALFVGSAFVLGLLGARFLKSSPPLYRSQERSWQRQGMGMSPSQPRQTSAYEGRTTADPSTSHPSRPVVSNPDAGAGMTPETRYGDR